MIEFKRLILITFVVIASQSFGQNKEHQTKKFGWVDTDGNKEVTMQELEEFHKGKTNKHGNPYDVDLMFLGLDSNDDGKLTLEEFVQPVNWKVAKEKRAAKNKKSKQEKIQKQKKTSISNKERQIKKFGWVDTNSDKEVTMEEMIEFHKDKTNNKGKPYDVDLMFLGLDSNDDGKLTMEEFVQPINWKLAKEKRKSKK